MRMETLARRALSEAMKQGAGEAEIYISVSGEKSIEVRNGQVETLKEAESSGMGVRVFRDGRMGFAYTSVLSDTGVEQACRKALGNTMITGPDEYNGLSAPQDVPYVEVPFDREIADTSVEGKIRMALAVEEAARETDNRITAIESCGYEDVTVEAVILNSLGVEAQSEAAYCGIYAALLAEEEGQSETGFAMSFKRRIGSLQPQECGREAAGKALRMLGAGSTRTRRMPLVFDPHATVRLLDVLAPSFSGENVLKGKSMLDQSLGQQAMAPCLTVVDDGTLDDGVMSAPADGEGMARRRNVLVDAGTVSAFLHNGYTARRSGTVTTGSASRGGYAGIPGVGTSNLFIQPGTRTEEELIGQVDDGLYLTDLLGVHTANPVTGDFSLGAAGLLIEGGRLSRPVRGIVISGNLLELFGHARDVADNLTFFAGTGAPSMLCGPLTVSGE